MSELVNKTSPAFCADANLNDLKARRVACRVLSMQGIKRLWLRPVARSTTFAAVMERLYVLAISWL